MSDSTVLTETLCTVSLVITSPLAKALEEDIRQKLGAIGYEI